MDEQDSEQDYFPERKKPVDRERSKYHSYADMIIDPMPIDDDDLAHDENSDIDPEDLRPYSQADTAFTNSASFDYRNFPKIASAKDEETKQLPPFI